MSHSPIADTAEGQCRWTHFNRQETVYNSFSNWQPPVSEHNVHRLRRRQVYAGCRHTQPGSEAVLLLFRQQSLTPRPWSVTRPKRPTFGNRVGHAVNQSTDGDVLLHQLPRCSSLRKSFRTHVYTNIFTAAFRLVGMILKRCKTRVSERTVTYKKPLIMTWGLNKLGMLRRKFNRGAYDGLLYYMNLRSMVCNSI